MGVRTSPQPAAAGSMARTGWVSLSAKGPCLVIFPGLVAMPLDVLRLFCIDVCQLVAGACLGMEELVELRLNRLGVAVFARSS
jgi:hypothetical protein